MGTENVCRAFSCSSVNFRARNVLRSLPSAQRFAFNNPEVSPGSFLEVLFQESPVNWGNSAIWHSYHDSTLHKAYYSKGLALWTRAIGKAFVGSASATTRVY